ncbi:ABC transporter permease [Lawsonella sp.]|uniref:galactan export ABC transporter permease subunit Wzm/RfbD n=1 Tax=Lawsonella sp. TaxID=2041415 RepID=UPI0039BF34C1
MPDHDHTGLGILAKTFEGEPPKSDSFTFKRAFGDLVDGWKSDQLWLQLGWQDIKQRYRRSTLGPFWITIATGVMAVALGLLYSLLFKEELSYFLPHVTLGLILWGFIAGCIQDGAQVFIANEGLIKQLPAPLSVHVYRLVWRQTLFLAHNMIIYIIMLIIFRPHLGWDALLFFPALLLFLLNGVWVAMFFGIISTRFRDVAPLVDSLVQLCFYMTPIVWTTHTLYANETMSQRARLAEINPLYHYLEIIRSPLMGIDVPAYHWYIVLGFTVVGWGLMLLVMKKARGRVSYWV